MKDNIDILVGLDYCYDFICGDRITFAGSLMLLESSLGFVCTGKVADESPSEEHSLLITEDVALLTPDAHLETCWCLEDIGVQPEDESTEVDTAYQQFNDAVYFEYGTTSRYVVSWPWRASHPDLSFNFQLALGRLKSLVN